MTPRRLFRRALRVLREECPLPDGVIVRARLVKGPHDWFGFTSLGRLPGHLSLRVSLNVTLNGRTRAATPVEIEDAIMHEWSHAVCYRPLHHPSVEDHDAIWGVNFAKAYTAIIGD